MILDERSEAGGGTNKELDFYMFCNDASEKQGEQELRLYTVP